MALNFEYQKNEYELLKDGIYEMNLTLSLKTSKTGKNYISLEWKVRDDVEQEFHNRRVFESVWEDKDNPGTFSMTKLSKILSIQGEDGNYHFEDIDEVLQFINGWNVRCGVKIGEPDEWRDEEYNYISFYAPTKFPTKTLSVTSAEGQVSKTIRPEDIPDEDLPF